jgi:thioredoxin-like negative regulator of GroEL
MKFNLIGDVELQEILDRDQSWALIFFSSWGSIPCKHFRPEFSAITSRFITAVYCAQINVEENPSIADKLGIVAVPTTLLLHKGKEWARYEGPYSHEALIERITLFLKKP